MSKGISFLFGKQEDYQKTKSSRIKSTLYFLCIKQSIRQWKPAEPSEFIWVKAIILKPHFSEVWENMQNRWWHKKQAFTWIRD